MRIDPDERDLLVRSAEWYRQKRRESDDAYESRITGTTSMSTTTATATGGAGETSRSESRDTLHSYFGGGNTTASTSSGHAVATTTNSNPGS